MAQSWGMLMLDGKPVATRPSRLTPQQRLKAERSERNKDRIRRAITSTMAKPNQKSGPDVIGAHQNVIATEAVLSDLASKRDGWAERARRREPIIPIEIVEDPASPLGYRYILQDQLAEAVEQGYACPACLDWYPEAGPSFEAYDADGNPTCPTCKWPKERK